MECKYCKSSWNSSVYMSNCPFCGNTLVQETTENMTVAVALRKIITDNGMEVLTNSRMLISLIADYVVGYDKEKKLLKIASANGVLNSIVKISQETNGEQQQVLIQKTKKILTDEAFLSDENAILILNVLLESIGIKKIEQQTKEVITQTPANVSVTPTVISKISATGQPAAKISTEDKMYELIKNNARLSKQDGEEMLSYGETLLAKGEKDKGIKFIRFAAQHGCLNAAVVLGDCYETGNGVPRDTKVADAYYRQAANSGNEEAKRKLMSSQFYNRNTNKKTATPKTNSTPLNSSSFFNSFKNRFMSDEFSVENRMLNLITNNARLSKQDGEEMLYLGKHLLDEGKKDKAIKFIKYAAQHGNSDAAVQMGICYETGNGVPKDLQIAWAYYRQAANSGNAEGKRHLKMK